MKLGNAYELLKGWILYKPFLKKSTFRFKIIKPILIIPKYISLGDNVFIRNNARIEGVEHYLGKKYFPNIIIDNNVAIEQNLHLTCASKIYIGENTAIAANVTITDINHPYVDINISPEQQMIEVKEVYIGSDCKIYNNVVILPGVKLGKHCVIGANSVVLEKEYPDFSIIIGSPAKIIKRYSFEKKEWLKTDRNGNYI